jgi:hypothetical protein
MDIDWQALCEYWQGILRLQDWDVKVVIARGREFVTGEGSQGECTWQLPTKQALIKLIDPIDYPTDTKWPYDPEKTLVHELLHLHFAPLGLSDDKEIEQEQAIDLIATGFLKVHRAGDRFAKKEDGRQT